MVLLHIGVNGYILLLLQIGEDGDYKSFLLEVKWHDQYPEEVPNINLAAFYNNHMYELVSIFL